MSGVKNLRAMFEQKGDTSPPAVDDRGRSPGAGSTGTESPRPISRIRSNFIAVEKDGRLGLQRDTSRDSSVSVSTRKLSGDLETPNLSRTTSQDNGDPSVHSKTEKPLIRRTSLKEQPIPESPRTDSVAQMPGLPLPKSPNGKTIAPPTNPDKTVDEEEVNTKMVLGGPTDKLAVTGNGSILPSGGFDETLNGTGGEKDKSKGKAEAKEATKNTTSGIKPTGGKTVAPVNTASKPSTKSTKSPTLSKPVKSPPTQATPKLASKTPERSIARPEKTSTPRATTTTSTPKAAASATKQASVATLGPSSVKKPPPLQPSPAGTGFVKPKVKSPTRPVKLPPGLTTHTTASATKFNVPRQSLSRAGHTAEGQARSSSRASISTTATRTTVVPTGKNLKRQSSTINRPRPSIGPPPKQASKDYPPTKKDTHVDESFLARMMRPTAASASKTHERVPVSPPRKSAAAPAVKKVVHKPEIKHAKNVANPTQPAAPSSSHTEQSPSAKEVAPIVEQAVAAEEATEAAREADGPAVSPEETKEEAAIKEIAPVVEQLESAEEVIEAAKGVEGEVALSQEPETEEHIASLEEEATAEHEVAEEAPSEATLVNGTNEKALASEPAEPADELANADGEKTGEALVTKEEVSV